MQSMEEDGSGRRMEMGGKEKVGDTGTPQRIIFGGRHMSCFTARYEVITSRWLKHPKVDITVCPLGHP